MASFYQRTPRRGRMLPESSIFYRTVRDVPVSADSARWTAWAQGAWTGPYVRCQPFNEADYLYANAAPGDSNRTQPSYYLDAPQAPVPGLRLCSTQLQFHGSPVTYEPNFFFPNQQFYMELSEVDRWRTEGGMPANNFRAGTGDSHWVTTWPTQRTNIEATLFDSVFDNRAECFIKRSFDSNARQNYSGTSNPAGATAGKVPIAALLITADEAKRGWINHTLMCVVENGSPAVRWPAWSSDGSSPDADAIPYGTFLRLKATFDVSPFHPQIQAVLECLKNYGAVIMDKSGARPGQNLLSANDAEWATGADLPDGALTIDNFDFLDMRPYATAPTTSWQCTPPGA